MIRQEVVRAVTDAVCHVLHTVAGVSAEVKKVQPVTQIAPMHEVCIGIGIEGGAEGGMYLIVDPHLGGVIAAKMDGEETSPDKASVDANLMELVNMIAGNSVGLLARAGLKISITPPASIETPQSPPYGAECAMVFMQSNLGPIKVGLVVSEAGGR